MSWPRSMHPFEAMAEPVRRRIIDLLSSGEHTAGNIAEVIGAEFRISRTATSKHLRILRDAGFVDVTGEWQWRWYRIVPEGIERLEAAAHDLREKYETSRDPLSPFRRPVTRKGPGRPHRRGARGTQTASPRGTEPDDWGW